MGLTAYVYRSDWNDPKNVFYGRDTIHVVNIPGPSEPRAGDAVALLEQHTPGACRLVPAILWDGEWVAARGMASGGTYGSTSDSRFSEAVEALLGHHYYGAVAIHDRLHWAFE
jgi:hypothetical protein